VGPHMTVDRSPRLSNPEEIEGIVDGAGLELGLGRGQRTLRATGGLGRQLDRALEEGGGGREATACLRPGRGMLQLGRNVLVRDRRRVRAMPRAAVGIQSGVGGRRERPVRLAPILGRCRAIDRGAQERVAEPDLQPDGEQPIRLRFSQVIGRDPELRAPTDEQRRPPRGIGAGDPGR